MGVLFLASLVGVVLGAFGLKQKGQNKILAILGCLLNSLVVLWFASSIRYKAI